LISVGSEVQILPGPPIRSVWAAGVEGPEPIRLPCRPHRRPDRRDGLGNGAAAGEPDQFGGVAQLGEHLLCKQGVVGSIPIVSTSALPARRVICQAAGQRGAQGKADRFGFRLVAGGDRWRAYGSFVSRNVRIRCAPAPRLMAWRGVAPFGWRLQGACPVAAAIVLCQGESGSGASLGACDPRSVCGQVRGPVVRPVCLTGRAVRKSSAPTVGGEGSEAL
jgi:hypothetical protein